MELLAILPAYLHSYNSRMARNSRNLEFPGPGDPCGPDGSGDPVAGLVVFKMFSLVLLAISTVHQFAIIKISYRIYRAL